MIYRMTALDPAGPLFTPFSTDALSKNDFQFVDSIHTSAGLAGEFEIRYDNVVVRVLSSQFVFQYDFALNEISVSLLECLTFLLKDLNI